MSVYCLMLNAFANGHKAAYLKLKTMNIATSELNLGDGIGVISTIYRAEVAPTL